VMHRIGFDVCPYCCNSKIYRSHPENWLDRILNFFPFDLARCHGCMRQHYRLLAFPAADFPAPAGRKSDEQIADDEQRSA